MFNDDAPKYEKPTIARMERVEPLKEGDAVVLRSGGPVMVVWGMPDQYEPVANVSWFLNGEVKRDAFGLSELVKVG